MKKLVRLLVIIGLFITAAVHAKTNNQTSPLPKRLTQEAHHSVVIERVIGRFSHSHYQQFTLNDALSTQIFDAYLDALDPKRVLFLESDVNQFSEQRTTLDNELRSKKIDTAYTLFYLAQRRYLEQTQYALSLLQEPMFFDGNDIIQLDRRALPRAKNKEEQHILWYSLVKNDAIHLKLSGKGWTEIQKILTKRYSIAQKQLALANSEDVLTLFINAFASVLDPHSNYLSPNDTANFITLMNLSLEGIGATLEQSEGFIQISSLVPNGPAAKSKRLFIGDKIIGVGQGNRTMVDIIGWRLDDVIALIKGPKKSRVRLEVLPKKGKKPKIVSLTREEIKFEEGKVKKEIKSVNGKNVAIITIPSFYIGVAHDTELILKELSNSLVNSVVIDLRMNGGGSLLEVIQLSDLFLPSANSPIVQVKASDGRIDVYTNNNTKAAKFNSDLMGHKQNIKFYFDKPMVVLVDRLSVSASEIFAAVMQDYGRAVIIGEATFGKGTVQESVSIDRIYDGALHPNWRSLGSLRYTNQKFYRVTGDSTQLEGVTPDLLMQFLIRDASDLGEKYEKNALPWDKISRASYSKLRGVTNNLSLLKERHEKRLRENEDYQFLLTYSENHKKNRQNQRTLSLNFSQRESEANADEQFVLEFINRQLIRRGESTLSSLDDLSKAFQLPDIYLDEAILVALDLSELQKK